MKPIAFMRLRKARSLQEVAAKHEPSTLVLQIKADGFKVMATRGRAKVRVFSRRGVDISKNIPAVVNRLTDLLPPNTTVLGELVYFVKGKMSLEPLQSIVTSGPQTAVIKTQEHGGDLALLVYDILEDANRDVTSLPWDDRDERMRDIVPTRGLVRVLKNYAFNQEKKALKEAADLGAEGLVIKVKSSPYLYRKSGSSEPLGQWFKFKSPALGKSSETDVILNKYKKGKEKYIFPAYQYKGRKLVEVGKLSGLDKKTEKRVVDLIDRGQEVIAEVTYQEPYSKTGKLRHMGWVRLRPDKPLKSVTMHNPHQKLPTRLSKDEMRTIRKSGSRRYKHRGKSGDYTFVIDDGLDDTFSVRVYDAEQAIVAQGVYLESQINRGLKAMQAFIDRLMPRRNPRPSLVKIALAKEALRHKKFDDFANRYWLDCARGLYWYATNDEDFEIDADDQALAEEGKFLVGCTPSFASKIYPKRRYIAELDVTGLQSKEMSFVRGSDGGRARIKDLSEVKVMRVMELHKARNAFRYQQSILPSSKDQLREVWNKAYEDEAIRQEKEAARERKREEIATRRRAAEIRRKEREARKKERAKKLAERDRKERDRTAKKRSKKRSKKS